VTPDESARPVPPIAAPSPRSLGRRRIRLSEGPGHGRTLSFLAMGAWAVGGLVAFFALGMAGADLPAVLLVLILGCLVACSVGLALAIRGQARALEQVKRPEAGQSGPRLRGEGAS